MSEVSPSPRLPLLLVDDESAWLRGLSIALEGSLGIDNVILCYDSREVPEILARTAVSLVLLDVTMPYLSGEELLAMITRHHPELPVIMLTGRDQVEIAVHCMQLGAFDYCIKTDKKERLFGVIRRALELAELRQENLRLRDSLLGAGLQMPAAFASFVTQNPRLRDIFRYIEAIAKSPEPVLITGESGTGKELIARAVHQLSRPSGPFVAVNAAGLDDLVFADTLFGHRRGAYTGAQEGRAGMIEQASGGVLFLDEIGDLSSASQVKLLRLLQEGEYFPLGNDRPSRLNARLVFATNCDLTALQTSGSFRRDLFYRLQTHHIHLPPLRERPEDIPLLLAHFLGEAAATLGKRRPTPPPELQSLLRTYPFPGNVRELRALVFDAVSRHGSGTLSMSTFKTTLQERSSSGTLPFSRGAAPFAPAVSFGPLFPTIHETVELLVDEALRRADGKLAIAAGLLGISRPALSKRLINRRSD
jgi:DNA-binding NtrC family response regulator